MRYHDLLDEDELRAYVRAINTRASALGISGRVTTVLLRDRILESAGRCEWCGCSLVSADFEVDHLISLSKGGANTGENLAVACPDCNRHKGSKHPAAFAAECIARTGQNTPLITRVLAHYQADPPAQQLTLFDD